MDNLLVIDFIITKDASIVTDVISSTADNDVGKLQSGLKLGSVVFLVILVTYFTR